MKKLPNRPVKLTWEEGQTYIDRPVFLRPKLIPWAAARACGRRVGKLLDSFVYHPLRQVKRDGRGGFVPKGR